MVSPNSLWSTQYLIFAAIANAVQVILRLTYHTQERRVMKREVAELRRQEVEPAEDVLVSQQRWRRACAPHCAVS